MRIASGPQSRAKEIKPVSGRPALIRERELSKAMNVARKAGAKELRVHLGDDVSIVIPLVSDDNKPVESERQITL